MLHGLQSLAGFPQFPNRSYGLALLQALSARCLSSGCLGRLYSGSQPFFCGVEPEFPNSSKATHQTQHNSSGYATSAQQAAGCAHASCPQHRQQCPRGASPRSSAAVAVGGTSASAHFRGFTSSGAAAGAVDDIDTVDCVVIGAGVIGLAVARALAMRGREVVLVEAAGAVGTKTSSRHSEVIHAGIYYPLGSLKARMCVQGKEMLYDYCRTHNVPYSNITKLIVATSKEQLPELSAFRATAALHGVPDLALLSGGEARELEPALACEGALLSPSTGIIDSHTYMASLLADAESHGAVTALHTRIVGGWLEQNPLLTQMTSTHGSSPGLSSSSHMTAAAGSVPYKVLELHTSLTPPPQQQGGGNAEGGAAAAAVEAAWAAGMGVVSEVSRLRARWVVNAAGLQAMRVAASVAGLPRSSIPRLHLAKGNYFSLSGRCPFRRLIYPLPERGLAGLGTHLTLDLAGGAKFGPDVEWLPRPGPDPAAPLGLDYRVDASRAQAFYPAIRRYYPALPDGALQPSYSGVRPKLSGPGEPTADFMVQGAKQGHGVRGWVNLYGIESPGLTSSLALAEHVCSILYEEAS